MNRSNDTSARYAPGARYSPGDSFASGRRDGNCRNFDRWVERTRTYLRSRTLDHWLMFAGGLLIGALLG